MFNLKHLMVYVFHIYIHGLIRMKSKVRILRADFLDNFQNKRTFRYVTQIEIRLMIGLGIKFYITLQISSARH